MFKQLSIIAKSVQKMGIAYGLINSIKLFVNRTNNVYVPFIKSSIKLRPKTSDIDVYKQIFIWEEYNTPINFNPSIIVDAGGNIGLSALYFSARYPTAKIYVLEPDKSNFAMLVENTKNFRNIFPIENALWGSNMTFGLNDSPNFWDKQVIHNTSPDSKVALTVNDIIKSYNLDKIDILKLDIEGAELDLFKGDVSWLKKIRMIIIELHDFMVPGCSKTFFTGIEQLNYSLDISGENIIVRNLDLV